MTTIAYRDGILAGDTLLTAGTTKLPEECRKVFRLRDGRLFGSSGESEAGLFLLDAVKNNGPTPKFKGVSALLIHPDGKIFFYEGTRWSLVENAEYAAIGNGSHYALGAMAVGASAREAVEAGIKHDTHSGGRIRTVSLRKKRGKNGR